MSVIHKYILIDLNDNTEQGPFNSETEVRDAIVESDHTIPQFYWDVYSAEQRVKYICYEIDKLANYANYLADTIKKIDAVSPDEFARYKDKLDSEIAALKTEIYNLQVGAISLNVQRKVNTMV